MSLGSVLLLMSARLHSFSSVLFSLYASPQNAVPHPQQVNLNHGNQCPSIEYGVYRSRYQPSLWLNHSSYPFVVSAYGNGLEVQCRSEEHTSELQSRGHLVCCLLLEKKKTRY